MDMCSTLGGPILPRIDFSLFSLFSFLFFFLLYFFFFYFFSLFLFSGFGVCFLFFVFSFLFFSTRLFPRRGFPSFHSVRNVKLYCGKRRCAFATILSFVSSLESQCDCCACVRVRLPCVLGHVRVPVCLCERLWLYIDRCTRVRGVCTSCVACSFLFRYLVSLTVPNGMGVEADDALLDGGPQSLPAMRLSGRAVRN